MSSNNTRKLSFAQLGELLQVEWEKGNLADEVHEYIEEGLFPIHLIRQQLKLAIARSDEEGYLEVTPLSREEDSDWRLAA